MLNRRLDEIASQVCGPVAHEPHKSDRPDEPAPVPHMLGQLSNGQDYLSAELLALAETITFLENSLGVEQHELAKATVGGSLVSGGGR